MHDATALRSTELTPCVVCGRALNHGLPIFYRFAIQRAGVSVPALRERAGLMQIWGGSAETAGLAEVFASRDPATVLDAYDGVCACHACAQRSTVEDLFLAAMARAEDNEIRAEEAARVAVPGGVASLPVDAGHVAGAVVDHATAPAVGERS